MQLTMQLPMQLTMQLPMLAPGTLCLGPHGVVHNQLKGQALRCGNRHLVFSHPKLGDVKK